MKVSDLIDDLETGDRSNDHLKETPRPMDNQSFAEALLNVQQLGSQLPYHGLQNALSHLQGGQQFMNQQSALQNSLGQIYHVPNPLGIQQGQMGGIFG